MRRTAGILPIIFFLELKVDKVERGCLGSVLLAWDFGAEYSYTLWGADRVGVGLRLVFGSIKACVFSSATTQFAISDSIFASLQFQKQHTCQG